MLKESICRILESMAPGISRTITGGLPNRPRQLVQPAGHSVKPCREVGALREPAAEPEERSPRQPGRPGTAGDQAPTCCPPKERFQFDGHLSFDSPGTSPIVSHENGVSGIYYSPCWYGEDAAPNHLPNSFSRRLLARSNPTWVKTTDFALPLGSVM